ncbi:protein CREG1 isoform X2 [Benincasa hispida]|nr:protein CREG1 isoform X2 [Benincasa hispida]
MASGIFHGLFYHLFFVYLASSSVGSQNFVQGRLLLISKPDPDNAAATARWLVSQNSWGILSTISSDFGGAPFGNVVSFSDGPPNEGRGIPYFYLTTLDPTAKYAISDERASFTLSEYPIGTCGKTDPENPTCAKITLIGKVKLLVLHSPAYLLTMLIFILCNFKSLFGLQLKQVEPNSKEVEFAKTSLFSKHGEMKNWPKDHDFRFYKLVIENIFLINWFGGPKPLTVDQYLHLKP